MTAYATSSADLLAPVPHTTTAMTAHIQTFSLSLMAARSPFSSQRCNVSPSMVSSSSSLGASASLRHCGHCDSPSRSLRKCSRCSLVGYRSKECQKGAWGSHRFWCVAAEEGKEGENSRHHHHHSHSHSHQRSHHHTQGEGATATAGASTTRGESSRSRAHHS